MAAYYNEIEPYAAQWLRNLITAGLLPQGEVDERSIVDVSPDDLRGFTQAHFFAGIGGWSHALRLAGWPDDQEVWTGSCPCQPFSVAGKGQAQEDERHLWPVFFELIRSCRPAVLMGEQVAAAVGKDWLDGVCADLESIGYACGATVVPACAVDAPHRRDRLWFVADARNDRAGRISGAPSECGRDALDAGAEGIRQGDGQALSGGLVSRGEGDVANADKPGSQGRTVLPQRGHERSAWSDAIWLTGADGKARRAKPGVPLLAHGVSARVGRLRAYGNAIVPQLAAEVIGAYMECRP